MSRLLEIINQVVNFQEIDLLTQELPTYVTNEDHKDILRGIYQLYFHKKSLTPETINHFLESQKYSEKKLNRVKHIFNTALELSPSPSPNLVADMKLEYLQNQLKGVSEAISDPNTTIDTKIDKISSLVANLTAKREARIKRLKKITYDYLEGMNKGEKTDFQKRIIDIHDPEISKLFSEHIYPRYYTILAAPGGFKTSVLINVHNYFSKCGLLGLHITNEDTPEGYTMKFISCRTGVDKQSIINGDVDRNIVHDNIEVDSMGDSLIYNRRLTATDLRILVKNVMDNHDIRWISLDYIQRSGREAGDDERTSLMKVSSEILDITNEYTVPFFALSQPTKTFDGNRITMANAKGAQELIADSRYILVLNNTETERSIKEFSWEKATDFPAFSGTIEFEGSTGKIKEVICDEQGNRDSYTKVL